MSLIEVARFSTLPEAELAVSLLLRHGIEAEVADREMGNNASHLQLAGGGFRITAPDFLIVEARELIARARRGEFGGVEGDDGEAWKVDHVPGRVGELDEGEVRGVMGSARKAGVVVIVLFFVIFPLAGCVMTLLGG